MPGVMPVASGGIHVWHMPALVTIFGDDSCLQFGGGTLGHPWGNAAGAHANRVAMEACVEARNQGRQVEREGREILTEAAQHSPELKIAMETWKEIKFEFDVVDKLDVARQPLRRVGLRQRQKNVPDRGVKQMPEVTAYKATERHGETFSYLPPMTPDRLRKKIAYLIAQGWNPAIEHTEPEKSFSSFWYLWKLPFFGERSVERIRRGA